MFFDLALSYDREACACELEIGSAGDLVVDETPITLMRLSIGLDRARSGSIDAPPQRRAARRARLIVFTGLVQRASPRSSTTASALPAPAAAPPAASPRSRKPIPRWAETPEQMRDRIEADRKARDARNDELFVQRPTSQAALAAIGAAPAGIAARDVMAAVPTMKRLEVTRMLKRLRNLCYLEVVGDRRHFVWKGTAKQRRMVAKAEKATAAS